MPDPSAAKPAQSLPPDAGYSGRFLLVAALFVTCLIVSNITAVKLIEVGGLVFDAAIVIFPLSYIIGDILTEVYGYARARRVIWLGFLCNLVAALAIWAAVQLPAASFWAGQAAYQQILGAVPRILAASFCAYLVGEFLNSYVLAKLKIATQGRWLWLRTIGSTLVGQFADSTLFVLIAFTGIIPPEAMILAILSQWLTKSAYEAAATPLTYGAIGWLKRAEGLDVYDRKTRFNPLILAD